MLPEIGPRRLPGTCPKLLLQGLQDLRRTHLLSTTLAEDASNQRRLSDHVGRRPRLGQLAECRVLARQERRVDQGRVDVGVDAGNKVRDVRDDLHARGSVELSRVVDLGL